MIGRSLSLTALACLFAASAFAQASAPAPVAPTPDVPLLSQQAPTDMPAALVPPPPPPSLPLPTPVQPPPAPEPPAPPTAPMAEAAPAALTPPVVPASLEPPAPPQTGFALPSSAVLNTPAPAPMPSPLMPPPPPSAGDLSVPSSPGYSAPMAAPSSVNFPSAPVVPTIAEPSQSPLSSGLQKVDARLVKTLKHLIRGIAATRELPDQPANDGALRRMLGTGIDLAGILGMAKFPVLPRFQARADETVVRNRSFDAWEYRFFGAFQTRLNGWVKPQALEVRADLKFDGRRKSWTRVTAVLTRVGQMTGRFTVQGTDAWGRIWNFAVEMQNLQLRDDGLPASGNIKISGGDPMQKSMSLSLRFPCEVIGEPQPPVDKRKKENRVSR